MYLTAGKKKGNKTRTGKWCSCLTSGCTVWLAFSFISMGTIMQFQKETLRNDVCKLLKKNILPLMAFRGTESVMFNWH